MKASRVVFSTDVVAQSDDLVVYEHAGRWVVVPRPPRPLLDPIELAACTSREAAIAAFRLLRGPT